MTEIHLRTTPVEIREYILLIYELLDNGYRHSLQGTFCDLVTFLVHTQYVNCTLNRFPVKDIKQSKEKAVVPTLCSNYHYSSSRTIDQWPNGLALQSFNCIYTQFCKTITWFHMLPHAQVWKVSTIPLSAIVMFFWYWARL